MDDYYIEKIPSCPYCGGEKLTAIDWGFANWECDTCRNNFKEPYYKEKYHYTTKEIKTTASSRNTSSKTKKIDFSKMEEYFILGFWIVCIVIIIIFIFFRIYENIIRII